MTEQNALPRPSLAPWAYLAQYDQKTDCKEVEA